MRWADPGTGVMSITPKSIWRATPGGLGGALPDRSRRAALLALTGPRLTALPLDLAAPVQAPAVG